MKKLLVSIGVFVLVVVLPAGSWYYLKTGLDYRKAALVKLEPKGQIDQSLIGEGDPLRSRTSLIELRANTATTTKLYDQFGEGETFTMWTQSSPDRSIDNWIPLDSAQTARLQAAYPEVSYMIVDTTGAVRSMYEDINEEVVKEMVSHLAIVMPRKKDKDIKMKNK